MPKDEVELLEMMVKNLEVQVEFQKKIIASYAKIEELYKKIIDIYEMAPVRKSGLSPW